MVACSQSLIGDFFKMDDALKTNYVSSSIKKWKNIAPCLYNLLWTGGRGTAILILIFIILPGYYLKKMSLRRRNEDLHQGNPVARTQASHHGWYHCLAMLQRYPGCTATERQVSHLIKGGHNICPGFRNEKTLSLLYASQPTTFLTVFRFYAY